MVGDVVVGLPVGTQLGLEGLDVGVLVGLLVGTGVGAYDTLPDIIMKSLNSTKFNVPSPDAGSHPAAALKP